MTEKTDRPIKSFVRREGRFTNGQKEAIETLGPEYLLEYREELIDYSKLFGNKNENILEIGFGNGLPTAEIADRMRDKNYIGIEVYKPGVGNLLRYIGEKKLSNIRIFNHDAVEIIESMIGDSSLDGFHIFFPDPWQKKKHKKRRLVDPEFTEKLVSKLKPGGYIYAVTDWEDYGIQMQNVLRGCSSLESPFKEFALSDDENSSSVTVPWRPETRFEEKGLKKMHEIYESYFIKT
jgi:tRNA (guanine-N7-)-methyltransferase